MNGSRTFSGWRLGLVLTFVLPTLCQADGGTVRHSEKHGPFHVTIFTSPNPFRAGPVDVSVLVQDATTRKPIQHLPVKLKLANRSLPKVTQSLPMTHTDSTNKLFYSAKFELPEAGVWLMSVDIQGANSVTVPFEVSAVKKLPRWIELWPWIVLPIVPMVLFLIHQIRRQRAKV